jgi:hypothetical protein
VEAPDVTSAESSAPVQLDVVLVVRGLVLGKAAPAGEFVLGGRLFLVPAVSLDVLWLAALVDIAHRILLSTNSVDLRTVPVLRIFPDGLAAGNSR